MSSISLDDQYDRIKGDLLRLGLSYERLLDDLLDHICCMVEEQMEEGADFESSYQEVLGSIGEQTLTNIQHQTLLNLDKKFQTMKNFTYIFGLSSAILTIIGSLFKRMHWPGAGILITVGMLLIVAVFLPLYFYTSYKEQSERKNPAYPIVGYLTLALLLAAATFKIMHWPGAGWLVYGSIGFLLLGFVPLYVVNVFQRSGRGKVSLPYIAMLLVGIACVMLIGNVNMGKEALDMYLNEALKNEKRVEEVQDGTARLLERARDSLYVDQLGTITEIHDQARDLQVMIRDMQEAMLVAVGQPGVAIGEIKGKDNKNAGREAILDSGKASAFILESRKFRARLMELAKDPVILSQIEDHMEYISPPFEFEHGKNGVEDSPLMKNYFKNTDASKGIALAEYVAITYLLHL